MNQGDGPLQGVTVLDLTSVLMGPFTTQILGDYGADVIKVEPPAGDSSRGLAPMKNPGMGSAFLQLNRNKRSIVLDLHHPDGHEAVMRLVERADVLVSNIRPAALARVHLGWDDVRDRNPGLVHAVLTGFGQDGPYATRAAYDDLIQGAIGLPSLIAATGDDGPRYVPLAFVDRTVGLAGVNAILAALYRRTRTGRGQAVEVPMFETMVPFVLGEHLGGATWDPPHGPEGYARLLSRDRKPYPTSDGYLCAVIYTDRHWRAFMRMLGREAEFETDPRMANIRARTEHIDALYAFVAEQMRGRTTREWLGLLDEADIPAFPLHTLQSLRKDPHLKAVDFFGEIDHPTEGRIVQMRHPARFSANETPLSMPAPRLGEHTDEILCKLGYSADAIAALKLSGAAAGLTGRKTAP